MVKTSEVREVIRAQHPHWTPGRQRLDHLGLELAAFEIERVSHHIVQL